MKRSLALLVVVLFFGVAITPHAALIVNEPFEYPPGLLTNQNGGSGWAGSWTNAGATNLIVAPGLQYDDGLYRLTTSSNAWQARGIAASSIRYLPSTLGETGQVFYVSFLGQLNSFFGYAGVFLDENVTARFSIGQTTGSATWSCLRIGASGLGSTLSVTNLTFVVVRLDYTNNNVIVRFYLNPPLNAEPPTSPTIPPLTTTAFKFNRVRLQAGDGLRTDLLDELRIGTTWADVAPHTFAPHLLTITNAAALEGNSGTTNLLFNVRLSRTNDVPVTVGYFTTNGTAVGGSDYVATNGVLTFNPGETNKTVSVAVIGETTVEFDEAFSLILSNAVNGQIRVGQGAATGTILDDDYVPPPLIAYEPFAYASGISINGLNGGTGWSNAWSGFGVTTISSPGLTYVAGTSSLAVSSNASRLSDPSFSFYTRGVQDLVRIKSGSVYLSFLGEITAGSPNISLYEGPSQRMIIGKYASANNWTAAVFGVVPRVMESSVPVSTRSLLVLRLDYTGTDTTVRFYVNPPLNAEPTTPTGQTNVIGLRFDVIGLNSGGPSAAATFDEIRVASTWAAAVPQGPPPPPNITITDAAVYESNSGTNLVFNVGLSSATLTNVLVNFATSNGTALAGSDYVATNGVLTFTPGQTTQTVVVPVIGDAVAETNETFSVILSNAVNGIIQDGVGTGFILDEDTPPRLAIGPGRVFEGDSGVTQAVFRVRLSQLYSGTVSVDYSTTNGSATAGVDYASAGGTVTFAPGEIRKNIAVQVLGDTTPELNETFAVRLTNPVNCTPVNTNGPGLIGDDDATVPAITNITLLSDGDPVPGEPGRVFKQFIGAPVMNVFNEIAFIASTMDTTGGAVQTNLWLWIGPTNELRKVAGPTMQPPDSPTGSTYNGQFAVPNLDDEGNLTFFAGVNLAAPGDVHAAGGNLDDGNHGLFVAKTDNAADSQKILLDDEQVEYFSLIDINRDSPFPVYAQAFGAIFDFAGAWGITGKQPLHVNSDIGFECNVDGPNNRTYFRYDAPFREFYWTFGVGGEDPSDGNGIVQDWQQHAVDGEGRVCVDFTTDDGKTTLAIIEPNGDCQVLATTGETPFLNINRVLGGFVNPFTFDSANSVMGTIFTFHMGLPPETQGNESLARFPFGAAAEQIHTTPAGTFKQVRRLDRSPYTNSLARLVAEIDPQVTVVKLVDEFASEIIVTNGQRFVLSDGSTGEVDIIFLDAVSFRNYSDTNPLLSDPYVPVQLTDGRYGAVVREGGEYKLKVLLSVPVGSQITFASTLETGLGGPRASGRGGLSSVINGPNGSMLLIDLFPSGEPEVPAFDYGDAPATSYPTTIAQNGARHVVSVSGPRLGAFVDADPGTLHNVTATSDDDFNQRDEDGITFLSRILPGCPAQIAVVASKAAKLDAWIDFNQDGDWDDEGEKVFNSVSVNAGNNILSFTGSTNIVRPGGIVRGLAYARFRLSTAGNLNYFGLATDGEVEDHIAPLGMVLLVAPRTQPQQAAFSWQDACELYVLQHSPQLNPANWQDVSSGTLSNGNWYQTINLTLGSGYYRLRLKP